ncbi:phage integrase SAM-like domain-containing protein [Rhodoflexus caldus]|uniref:phage integrase SAM-like domain-containing protein n=1 Tax=Rhodoflexus caldus TaxID=2891236 RepID=UPI00202A7BA1|nr:phage integrase SAM-like domain-containing protein [Rhodoflexus caldus]
MLYVLFRARARQFGKVSIYCRITLNSERASEFFTGITCQKNEWEQQKQRVRGNEPANEVLRQIAQDVRAVLNRMLYAGEQPNAQSLRDTFLNKGERSLPTISEVLEQLLDSVETNNELAERTKRKYETGVRKIQAFIRQTRQEALPAAQVGKDFAERYALHLRDKVGNSRNTIAKEMEILRAAVRPHQDVPLQGFTYSRRKPAPPAFLTAEEVERIATHRFASERLQQVADLFLFQIGTGLAYCDMAKFNADIHLKRAGGEVYLYMPRQKSPTDAAVVPLCERTLGLLTKYANLLPVISLAKYNSYLKEVGEIVGIGQKLTTHLARKTAGHLWLASGLSYEQVAFRLGHSKIETTRQYYARLRLAV